MKKLLIAMIAMILLSGVLGGCTMDETPIQHSDRLRLQGDIQSRQLVEDFDMFWLCDHTSRLSQWHSRTGI